MMLVGTPDRLWGEAGRGLPTGAAAARIDIWTWRSAKLVAASPLRDGCDEFRGCRRSLLVIPVASDPTTDSARAGVLEF
jgi:hypothetical protein